VGCKGKEKSGEWGRNWFNFFLTILWEIFGLIIALREATSNHILA
jgi:hypothetical protein